tara:strand:- start:16 stop:351 length:336 start_codon:yes stop_codon:yes gene_type:complete
MKVNDCVHQSYQNALQKGWWEDERSVGELIALMHSELSEALEEHRNGHSVEKVYYNDNKPNKPEGVAVELADCVIRIFDFCGRYDIDLESILKLKMEYNSTRPYRHGNKVI